MRRSPMRNSPAANSSRPPITNTPTAASRFFGIKPNPQSSILNPQSSILNPQSPILNPQSPILNPQGLSFSDAGNARRASDRREPPPASSRRPPHARRGLRSLTIQRLDGRPLRSRTEHDRPWRSDRQRRVASRSPRLREVRLHGTGVRRHHV